MQPYSPERRTALVLCGTGAHGAYHAGVLRAFREAGVKIDVVAGQGMGAASAALAAIDGDARLWDEGGVWRSAAPRQFYQWKWPLRAMPYVAGGLAAGALGVALWPQPMPGPVRWLPLVALVAIPALAAAGVYLQGRNTAARRRTAGAWWWRLAGAPFDTGPLKAQLLHTIWQLVRGGDQRDRPQPAQAGLRFAEVLFESLGQPGFRELMVIATDLDTRRDILAALLSEPYRRDFMAERAYAAPGERVTRPTPQRRAEVIDLAGVGREHGIDIIAGAVTPPGADPHLITFNADSHWRGETHRLCDRAGSVTRLLEELSVAGVSQVVIVSAVSSIAAPHRLRSSRVDLPGRLGEALAADEAASLRDAMEMARLRFDSAFLIAPAHNPIGAFDFAGAYDDASDRQWALTELMERAYEDAYHQFIDPVVGASGEHLARATPGVELRDPDALIP